LTAISDGVLDDHARRDDREGHGLALALATADLGGARASAPAHHLDQPRNENTMTTIAAPVLEPAAQAFAEATATPPFLSDLPPFEGRALVDAAQSGEIAKPDIDEGWITIAGGPTGEVKVRIVKPRDGAGTLPVILYIRGAGWVFADAHTHDRLVRELAVGAGAAVVFSDYDRYPVAIEQNYAVAQWVVENGAATGLDAARFAVAGDSVGVNMAAALTLMAKVRSAPKLAAQVLFYPVTDANFDTRSYQQFAEGYVLRRDSMQVLGPVHHRRGAAQRDHCLTPARDGRAARRAAVRPGDHRRSRRPPRRGRGVREQAARRRRPGHRCPLPGDHPRLRDAQRPARDPRRRRGDPPGHRVPQRNAPAR
jgi:acetyl esterase